MDNTTVIFTPLMYLLVAAVAAFLQGIKSRIIDKYPRLDWVKAFFPLVAIFIGGVLCRVTQQADPLVSGLFVGIAASWGFDMFKGLSNAEKPPVIVLLVLCCLGLLVVSGCNKVQMSPQYQQVLEMSAINVGELDRRCQAGDGMACKDGLRQGSKTLNLLVDATHGRASDPNS